MRRHSARPWPHLGVLTLSLSLLGCGPSVPPAPGPEEPAPRSEARPMGDQQSAIPRAFASGNSSAPLDLRTDAPPPEARPQGNTLTQPDQPALSLEDLQGGLPSQIPQAMAGALLRPLQGGIADVRAPGLDPGAGDGCAYGALPGLLDYGVYPQLLYYNFRSCWVPYILVDDCYYPYVYQPYFDPLFTGYCYYPLFVYRHGYYYPYYFHSRSYYYGYLDWEYNWRPYRERYADYDWDDIGRRRLRRYNDDDFNDWRQGKVRRRDRTDWQRAEPPRRQGREERGERPQRPSERPDRPDRPSQRLDRADRPSEHRAKQDAEKQERRELRQRPEAKEGRAREKAERKDAVADRRSSNERVKPPRQEGRKGRGERRLQSEDETEEETLD